MGNHAAHHLPLLQVFCPSKLYICFVRFLWFIFPFSEQCIEAYELLLALAESEQSLILGQFRAAGVGSVGKMSMNHFFFSFSCQLPFDFNTPKFELNTPKKLGKKETGVES